MSVSQFKVIYNGVTIHDVVLANSSEDQYDDTGTDIIFTKQTFEVKGSVTLDSNTTVRTDPTKESVPKTWREVQARLSETRQTLEIYSGNELYRKFTPSEDVALGPKPKGTKVLKLIGSKYVRFSWTIECSEVLCAGLKTGNGPVLHNRWSVGETFDNTGRSTRVYRGKLTLRQGAEPHSLRDLCVPPLQRTFKRERVELLASPDHRHYEYTVEDKQVHRVPPAPATDWDARFRITSSDGFNAFSEFDVNLKGAPGTASEDLFALAVSIIDQRIQLAKILSGDLLVESIDTLEVMQDSEIRMLLRARHNGGLDSLKILSGQNLGGGFSLAGYNPQVATLLPLNGTAPLAGLLAARLQSPCGNQESHKMVQDGDVPGGVGTIGDGSPVVEYYVAKNPQAFEKISESVSLSVESHKSQVFTLYQVSYDYETDEGRIPMRSGKTDDDSEDTSIAVRVLRPSSYLTIRVTAERHGAVPQIPGNEDWTDENGIKYWIRKHKFGLCPPTPATNSTEEGGMLQRVDGHYEFILNRSIKKGDKLLAGWLPWLSQANEKPAVNTSELFFDPATGPSGA